MYYDTHEMVRFQVIAEEWHDQTPSGPVGPGDEVVARANAPYRLVGSMKSSGLGVCLWW